MPDEPTDLPSKDDLTRALAAQIGRHEPPVDEELWERRMSALTLRNAGGTFQQIATQLHISPSIARADVRLALREVLSETTEDFIARQRSVLLDMQRGAYPAALRGDRDAIVSIVKCLEQEAKLLGLYAPTRQVVGISDVDFAEQAADLIARLGLTPPRELTGNRVPAAAVLDAETSEIIADCLERLSVDGELTGFDLPLTGLPVECDPLGVTIGDETISRAAAEAIAGGETGGDGDRWSNL